MTRCEGCGVVAEYEYRYRGKSATGRWRSWTRWHPWPEAIHAEPVTYLLLTWDTVTLASENIQTEYRRSGQVTDA